MTFKIGDEVIVTKNYALDLRSEYPYRPGACLKFKVGDKVVVARLDESAGDPMRPYVGKSFIILRSLGEHAPYPYYVDSTHFSFGNKELEHEHIYNSPLSQELE